EVHGGLDVHRTSGLRDATCVAQTLLVEVVGLLHVATRRLAAERLGAIHKRVHLRPPAALHVALEAGGNLDREAQLAVAKPSIEPSLAVDRGPVVEVLGAPEAIGIQAAADRVVGIEYRKRKMVNIERDAITENDHEQDRPKHGKGEAHPVMLQFDRFAPCKGPHASETEPAARRLSVS